MNTDRTKLFLWIAAISLIGIIDSVWLLKLHLTSGTCSANAYFNCSAVSSSYSTWWEIPIPIISGLFYINLFALSLRQYLKPSDDPKPEIALVFFMSWVAILSTIAMAVLSGFVLHAFCPFCFILYLVSIGLFIIARQLRKSVDGIGMWAFFRKSYFWSPLLFTAFALVATHARFHGLPKLSAVVVPLHAEDLRSTGPATAKWVITTFSDFQCPYCKVAAMVMRELEHDLGDQVRIVYKFFPLDSSCNPSGGRHQFSCNAARAAFCASLQHKFWPYHDLLFTSQEDLPGWRLQTFATEAGLDIKAFGSCVNDAASEKAIKSDLSEGATLGIEGTPSIFINGRKFSGTISLTEIKEALTEPSK